MSVAPLVVAERVRAIEFVSSEVLVDALPARTALDEAVAVDWGSVASLEATL
jgi:hypothetical protein